MNKQKETICIHLKTRQFKQLEKAKETFRLKMQNF